MTETAEVKGTAAREHVGAAAEDDEKLWNGVGDVLFFILSKKKKNVGGFFL